MTKRDPEKQRDKLREGETNPERERDKVTYRIRKRGKRTERYI